MFFEKLQFHQVWDANTGNLLHTLTGHQSLTSGMELRLVFFNLNFHYFQI